MVHARLPSARPGGAPARHTARGALNPAPRPSAQRRRRLADNNLATFVYDRALATIETSNLEAGDNSVHRRFEFFGERGTILISPLEPPQVRLYLTDPFEELTAGWQTVEVPWRPRCVGDLEHFLACVSGESAPLVTPGQDLAVQEALLRASGVEN